MSKHLASRNQAIANAVAAGESPSDLAAQWGISRNRVYGIVYSARRRGGPSQESLEAEAAFRDLADAHNPPPRCAEDVGRVWLPWDSPLALDK